jgi:hypothetical protein
MAPGDWQALAIVGLIALLYLGRVWRLKAVEEEQ